MRVKPQYLTPQLDKIARRVFNDQVKRTRQAGQKVGKIATDLIEQTFKHWNESGENKFKYPVVKVTVDVKSSFNSGKIEVTVHIVVIDPSTGQPHFLWHILDRGRGAYTFPAGKRTPPLKKRKRRRTKKDTLKVDPFPGFTGETFVIHGGQNVKAVPANNWYEQAAQQTNDKIRQDDLLRSFKWSFVIVKMK